MGRTYTIRLDGSDLGQLLDGLRCRSDSWHGTAEYFESGATPHEGFIIEDCNDEAEARAIAEDYDRIVSDIQNQMKAQEDGS